MVLEYFRRWSRKKNTENFYSSFPHISISVYEKLNPEKGYGHRQDFYDDIKYPLSSYQLLAIRMSKDHFNLNTVNSESKNRMKKFSNDARFVSCEALKKKGRF